MICKLFKKLFKCKDEEPEDRRQEYIVKESLRSYLEYRGKKKDAQKSVQILIDNDALKALRYRDPNTGTIKEVYYTTFPEPGWVNEIGYVRTGERYVLVAKKDYEYFKF